MSSIEDEGARAKIQVIKIYLHGREGKVRGIMRSHIPMYGFVPDIEVANCPSSSTVAMLKSVTWAWPRQIIFCNLPSLS